MMLGLNTGASTTERTAAMGMALWLAPADETAALAETNPDSAAVAADRLQIVTEAVSAASIRNDLAELKNKFVRWHGGDACV